MGDGPPGFPQGFSCPAVLRYRLRVGSAFAYAAITRYGPAFQRVRLAAGLVTLLLRALQPPAPRKRGPGFGLFRFRSPLLSESRFLFFPPGTEMVHFPGFARTRLWIQRAVAEVRSAGFPHSEISGSKPVCGSPKLIAANHVLHRLLAPRHPPYALSSLTTNSPGASSVPGIWILHPFALSFRRSSAGRELGFAQSLAIIRLSNSDAPRPGARAVPPRAGRIRWVAARRGWWAWVESNYRPHPYQGCALAI